MSRLDGTIFRNPGNGDLREYSYSYIGFFFFGILYLLYKNRSRAAARVAVAELAVAALCGVASRLPLLSPVLDFGPGGFGPVVLSLAALAVHVWFLLKNPEYILRDLFISGYSPADEEGWEALEDDGTLTDDQIESYRDAHAHRPAEGPRPGYACLMGAVRACGLREGDDYRRLEGPVEGVRLRLSPKDDALASLFGALGAEDGEGAASEILSCDPSEELRQMSFGRCRVRWVRTPRGVANLEVFERPDEWGLPAPRRLAQKARHEEPEPGDAAPEVAPTEARERGPKTTRPLPESEVLPVPRRVLAVLETRGLREGPDYRPMGDGRVRLFLRMHDGSLASLLEALGAEDGEALVSRMLSSEPSPDVQRADFNGFRLEWVRGWRFVTRIDLSEPAEGEGGESAGQSGGGGATV